MQMLRERLSPRVQNRRDADRAAQVARVPAKCEERVGSRAKQECVDYARIALGEGVECVREREDDVEVRNGQQVGLASREPPLLGSRLALGTVAIATGVIGDARRTAVVTRLPMSAQDGSAAGRDRPQGAVLGRRQSMRPSIGVAVRADDVRELEAWTDAGDGRAQRHGTHRLALLREPCEEIERGVRADLRVARQLEVPGRRTDVAVTEQTLNGVEIDTGLEQVRRERVPQSMNPAGFGNARTELRRLVGPLKGRGVQRLSGLVRGKQPRPGSCQSPILA